MKARIIIFLVLAVISVAAMVFIYSQMSPLDKELAMAQGDTIISLELALTPTRTASVLDGWKSYVSPDKPELTLLDTAKKCIHWDWFFIAAYLSLMLSISALILNSKKAKDFIWNLLILIALPIGAALLDTAENLGIYYLLRSEDMQGFLFSATAVGVGLLAATKFILLFIYVVTLARSLKDPLKVLFLPRFSLLILAIGLILIVVPQWQEILISVAEGKWYLSIWLGFATFIASIAIWYSTRVMYMLKLTDSDTPKHGPDKLSTTGPSKPNIAGSLKSVLKPSDSVMLREMEYRKFAPITKRWLPRLLGSLMAPIIVVGLFVAMEGKEMHKPLWVLGVAWALYLTIVISRRYLAKKLHKLLENSLPSDKIDFLIMSKPDEEFGKYDGYRKLPWFTKRVHLVLHGLYLLSFLAVWFNPLWVQGVGSGAVALMAIGLMIPTGNLLVYFGIRRGLPMLLLAFTFAILCSFYNDNHWVRLSIDASSTDDAQEVMTAISDNNELPRLKKYASAWAEKLQDKTCKNCDIPLFIVSAEGGGIRAAYWTALALGTLQDIDQDFGKHVFAISGVSGGSLGGAVFAAQIANRSSLKNTQFRDHADLVLQKDFLAPTLATLLFPDLIQRFLPWAFFNDRAITIEKSWEDAWTQAFEELDSQSDGDKSFSEPFAALWKPKDKTNSSNNLPLLYLNSTVVETGNRLIMHPLGCQEDFNEIFKDAVDGRVALGPNIPLSTAVHLSARFTYVSPAGSIHNYAAQGPGNPDRNRNWLRLVDGGYFENSGAVTARELLAALKRYKAETLEEYDSPSKTAVQDNSQKELPALARINPFVIHISNEPIKPKELIKKKHRGKQAPLGEALSPLFALINARPAKGIQARQDLFQDVTGMKEENYVHFIPRDLGITLPLGWVLSEKARLNMQQQLPTSVNDETETQSKDEEHDANQLALNKVIKHLKAGK